MSTDIKKYLALQTALVNEKARIESHLGEINRVLGQGPSSVAPTTADSRRKFSGATKAKMRAAQKARWAKAKGKADPAATPEKRKMSAEGRAAIVAAAKARWAKAKAAGRKTLASGQA